MRCPVDNETLVMADRGGVEIDYCPKCRGVWLDRGELDKIIDRSAGAGAPPVDSRPALQMVPPAPQMYQQPPVYQQPPTYGRRDDDDDDDDKRGYRKKRRESFLGDLFDF